MSFDPSHLLSQLNALKREDGDIRLTCDGIVINYHGGHSDHSGLGVILMVEIVMAK